MNKKNSVLPEKFTERLREIAGVSLFNQIEPTFGERPTTFRVNSIKTLKPVEAKPSLGVLKHENFKAQAEPENIRTYLEDNGFKIRQLSWYKDAYILLNKSKRELTNLPLYNEGKIYIQSLASMIPPLILAPQAGEKVLDLTAAPGSKTSQIAALMNRTGELVANDVNKMRFFKLKHNMELLGVADATQNWSFKLRMEHGGDLCREYHEYFDKILLDAPCSAEARFIDGDSRTFGYWSERKIKEMAYKQWGLLLAAWGALKPRGALVYSTCTFAPEENELQITKFLERTPNALLVEANIPELKKNCALKEWKGKIISEIAAKHCFRILPTKEIEGFFVAKIIKK